MAEWNSDQEPWSKVDLRWILDTQKNLNLKIKFRESFRPLPHQSCLRRPKLVNLKISPYMLLVADVSESIKEVIMMN